MSNADLARDYFRAVQEGNMARLGELIDENVLWHQPGANRFSGEQKGRDAVFGMIGQMMQLSNGTFAIDKVNSVLSNGDMVAATIHFSAQRDSNTMSQDGVDVMRFKDGTIVEMWLFSGDQPAEDAFWGRA